MRRCENYYSDSSGLIKSPILGGIFLWSVSLEYCFLQMVGIVRMYVYKQGVTNVFDFPKSQAKEAYKNLLSQGYTIYHTVLV